jgi:Protein kinase domain
MKIPFKNTTKRDTMHLQVKTRFLRLKSRLSWNNRRAQEQKLTSKQAPSVALPGGLASDRGLPQWIRISSDSVGPVSQGTSGPDQSLADGESIDLFPDPEAQNQDSDLEPVIEAYRKPTLDEIITQANGHFKDIDFVHISEQLEKQGKTAWSRIPRIFTWLYLINQLDSMEKFCDLTDADLPLRREALIQRIPSVCEPETFIKMQKILLPDIFELETPEGPHLQIEGLSEQYFRTQEVLGQGKSGFVVQVESRLSLKQYALKRHQLSSLERDTADMSLSGSRRNMSDLYNEISILKRLSHRHLVQFVGSFTDRKYFGLLISPVADMDLRTFLDQENDMDLGLKDLPNTAHYKESFEGYRSVLMSFYGCLTTALSFLHGNQVRHKDIKPGNILIKDSKVYLTDFGLARQWNDESRSATTRGEVGDYTVMYAAPEVVDEEVNI